MTRNGHRRLGSRLDELERLLQAELAQPAPVDPYAGMSDEERLERIAAVLAILTRALGREGVREMLRAKGHSEATLDMLEPLFEEAEAAG